jgi:hypothetical protein
MCELAKFMRALGMRGVDCGVALESENSIGLKSKPL